MARDHMGRASRTLGEAREAFKAGGHPLTIRRAQEAVELSLKAALRFLAVEYPREHDVGDILLEFANARRARVQHTKPTLRLNQPKPLNR